MATTIAKAAHSAAVSLFSFAQVKAGSSLPALLLKESSAESGTVATDKLIGKNIILGVPGAFTPPCSSQVPGYIEKYQDFKNKGVNGIYVVAVNDAFVTQAWKNKLAPNGTDVHFIADDQAEFVSKLGLIFDATPLLGGPRSKRFALTTNDGVVEKVFVEEAPPDVTVTSADNLLKEV